MKRYYLSKITASQEPQFGTVIRHRVQSGHPGVEYLGGEIESDPATGLPVHPALLVMISGVDHARFQGDDDLVPIPDVGIDMSVGAIALETKLATKAAIIALGFDAVQTEALWQNENGMRQVLNHYGRLNNADFDADHFDLYQN